MKGWPWERTWERTGQSHVLEKCYTGRNDQGINDQKIIQSEMTLSKCDTTITSVFLKLADRLFINTGKARGLLKLEE